MTVTWPFGKARERTGIYPLERQTCEKAYAALESRQQNKTMLLRKPHAEGGYI